MLLRRSASLVLCAFSAIFAGAQQLPKVRKPKAEKEPPSQTLPLQKEPPAAVVAETARLTFHVSPLSNKGLLSQQTRDALKTLFDANHGAAIVKLRAFVAGTGDLRRVQTIVGEVFGEKKMALPALTTIQVGALPLEGAQVVLESISSDKKAVNPNGLVWFPTGRAAEIEGALAQIGTAAGAAQVASTEVLEVTCFLSALDEVAGARSAVTRAFPLAAVNLLENERLSTEKFAQCEAVGRLGGATGTTIDLSGAALINSPKLVLTSTQMAFHEQDADLNLAFERLAKTLDQMGVTSKDVVVARSYALTRTVAEKVGTMGPQEFPHALASVVRMEALPSVDASMAIEVIAPVNRE